MALKKGQTSLTGFDRIDWVGGFFVKLHSNLQTQLNFSWFEEELTLFSHGKRKKEEEGPTPSFLLPS